MKSLPDVAAAAVHVWGLVCFVREVAAEGRSVQSLSLRASLPSGIVGMELHRWSRRFHSFPARPASCNVGEEKIRQNKQKNTRLCDALASNESTRWVQRHLHTLRFIFRPSEVVLLVYKRSVRPVVCRETTELKDEVTTRCVACSLRPSRRWADSWLISVFSCSASLRFHDYLLWTPLFCFNDAKRTRGMKQNRIWSSLTAERRNTLTPDALRPTVAADYSPLLCSADDEPTQLYNTGSNALLICMKPKPAGKSSRLTRSSEWNHIKGCWGGSSGHK